MGGKSVIAALSAIALTAAPTAVSAQTAAPPAAATEVHPGSETVEGNEIRGGYLLPLAIIIAIIIGVLLLTKDDEDPISA